MNSTPIIQCSGCCCVGERLAPPETFGTMTPKRGANETPCRGSAKALPYNFTATSLVGEGLAPPETFGTMSSKCEA